MPLIRQDLLIYNMLSLIPRINTPYGVFRAIQRDGACPALPLISLLMQKVLPIFPRRIHARAPIGLSPYLNAEN